MSFIKETEEYLKGVLKDIGYETEDISLEFSARRDLGEFQINCAMSLAKKYGENPRDIATKIVNNLDDRFENVNIAGPGFINVSINNNKLLEVMNKSINDFDNLIDKQEEKTIIVDYGGANAAKALHIGHMRAANIGEALKRLAKRLGNKTIGDVHLGDLGRQAGMLISEYKLMEPDSVFFDPNYKGEYPKINLTIKDLGIMYPKASEAAKNDEKRMEEVREITAEIDKGHKAYTELWKQMVDISSVEIKRIYDLLNCHFELWEGELSSFKYIPETLEIMKPFLYESEGALICDVEQEDDKKPMPPLMVIKSDGATIYGTRDLATLYSRIKEYNPNEIWYVVDARQSLYFEQVFRASYKTGLVPKSTILSHYGFGTMNGKDGKPFKTRDGGVLELNELIKMVKEELKKRMDRYDNDKESEEIVDKLTIATIKYADLLPFRTTDYIFDVEKFCSFEGKTGPYILYTLVRINSILNKTKNDNIVIKDLYSETEKNIYIKLTELSRYINRAYNEKATSYICEYLFELCSLFNKFYGETNVLNESNDEKKNSYLAMLRLIYNTCKELLDILAIEIPSKM